MSRYWYNIISLFPLLSLFCYSIFQKRSWIAEKGGLHTSRVWNFALVNMEGVDVINKANSLASLGNEIYFLTDGAPLVWLKRAQFPHQSLIFPRKLSLENYLEGFFLASKFRLFISLYL